MCYLYPWCEWSFYHAQVATVIPTPTVHPSTNLIYLTKSPRVMVNGTNFDEKNTFLFFNPPLVDGTDINTFVSVVLLSFVAQFKV